MSCFIGVFVWGGNLDALWFEVLLFVSVLDASVLKRTCNCSPKKSPVFVQAQRITVASKAARGRSVGGSMATKDSRDGGGW